MANTLTGDFDVVFEFAVLAVNRLLAAMHQTGRFLHSMSVRVDDSPHPTRPGWPVVLGTVDAFGDVLANHRSIGHPNPFPGAAAATDPAYSRVGVLLNPDVLVAAQPQIVPSHISGVAQLQLFPPTVAVPDASGMSLTVRMNLMARFIPDKNTAPLAEFMRGDLQITAPLNKIVSDNMQVLEIDFKADEATINFAPSYSSQPLSAEDLAGINLCIQNGLRTSFLPSSVNLPSSIANVELKTLPGALAVLLDLNDHPSTVASVNDVFLTGDDDFAFAVGRDYLLNALSMVGNNILSQPISTITFSVWVVFETLHYSYPIKLTSASFDLQTEKIVLTIKGDAGPEAHGHSPDKVSFTVTVDLGLQASGYTVSLVPGNVSVSTDSTLAAIADFFTGGVTDAVKNAVYVAITSPEVGGAISKTFDAYKNLGDFLNPQLNPSDGSLQIQPQQVFLLYTSADIQTAGVVLHGSMLCWDWPDPYVEFEQIPQNTSPSGIGGVSPPIGQGTDYSALKTWIPGGTIGKYEWSVQGQEQAYPFDVDPNRFVLLHSGEAAALPDAYSGGIPGYSPLCLTITGNRISNYGSPPVYQNVTASVCGYTRFPFPVGVIPGKDAAALTLAITRPAPSGGLIVSGHASADVDRSGSAAPNLVVHFADAQSSGQLQFLTQALGRSKRNDAPTAVLAVLTPEQLSKAPFTPGIVYAEDREGNWQSAVGVKSDKRPLTLIVSPRGSVAWQNEGALNADTLAAALAKHLVKRPPVRLSLPRLNVRIGLPAPNFLFEYASGREMPLTKLSGQPIILVFWKSSVRTSLQAVRDLQVSPAKSKSPAPIVLAVNDGEDPGVARAVAAESGLTAILVTDPKREIGLAYGVTLWPTIVMLDASGMVAGIRYGYVPGEQSGSPSKRAAAS